LLGVPQSRWHPDAIAEHLDLREHRRFKADGSTLAAIREEPYPYVPPMPFPDIWKSGQHA
jgi:hypothetical protein